MRQQLRFFVNNSFEIKKNVRFNGDFIGSSVACIQLTGIYTKSARYNYAKCTLKELLYFSPVQNPRARYKSTANVHRLIQIGPRVQNWLMVLSRFLFLPASVTFICSLINRQGMLCEMISRLAGANYSHNSLQYCPE